MRRRAQEFSSPNFTQKSGIVICDLICIKLWFDAYIQTFSETRYRNFRGMAWELLDFAPETAAIIWPFPKSGIAVPRGSWWSRARLGSDPPSPVGLGIHPLSNASHATSQLWTKAWFFCSQYSYHLDNRKFRSYTPECCHLKISVGYGPLTASGDESVRRWDLSIYNW